MGTRIEHDNPRERKRARINHRIGVTVFTLILLAAVVGLLGEGPLSEVAATSPDRRLAIKYYRFIHYQSTAELKIQVSAEGTSNGLVRLQLSNEFVDWAEIERIDPEPESVSAGAKFSTYSIRAETNAPAELKVRFAAGHFGKLAYEVAVADGPSLRLRHFAFP